MGSARLTVQNFIINEPNKPGVYYFQENTESLTTFKIELFFKIVKI